MSLEHAILGFLNYRPFSGYDLKKIFDTSVRHFWPADQSQIYRTLNRLTKQGWAEMKKIEQDKRPDRKEYHITEAGREELGNWLLSPIPFEENRSAPMIQVFFAGQLSDEEVIEIFERVAETMRAGLGALDAIPQDMEAYQEYSNSPREFYFWMLTLDIGRHTAQANLTWIEKKLESMRNGAIPQA